MNKEVYNEIDNDAVMDLALQAGHILLQSGAEISRVEETMQRICAHFGVQSEHVFVLTNGIFFTGGGDREHVFAKVEHIPVSGTRMDRIVEVNQLSRDIERGRYTVEAAVERLGQIRNMTEKRKMVRVLAAGAGSAGWDGRRGLSEPGIIGNSRRPEAVRQRGGTADCTSRGACGQRENGLAYPGAEGSDRKAGEG